MMVCDAVISTTPLDMVPWFDSHLTYLASFVIPLFPVITVETYKMWNWIERKRTKERYNLWWWAFGKLPTIKEHTLDSLSANKNTNLRIHLTWNWLFFWRKFRWFSPPFIRVIPSFTRTIFPQSRKSSSCRFHLKNQSETWSRKCPLHFNLLSYEMYRKSSCGNSCDNYGYYYVGTSWKFLFSKEVCTLLEMMSWQFYGLVSTNQSWGIRLGIWRGSIQEMVFMLIWTGWLVIVYITFYFLLQFTYFYFLSACW